MQFARTALLLVRFAMSGSGEKHRGVGPSRLECHQGGATVGLEGEGQAGWRTYSEISPFRLKPILCRLQPEWNFCFLPSSVRSSHDSRTQLLLNYSFAPALVEWSWFCLNRLMGGWETDCFFWVGSFYWLSFPHRYSCPANCENQRRVLK